MQYIIIIARYFIYRGTSSEVKAFITRSNERAC